MRSAFLKALSDLAMFLGIIVAGGVILIGLAVFFSIVAGGSFYFFVMVFHSVTY